MSIDSIERLKAEKLKRLFSSAVVALAVAQLVLVLVSWLLSAMMTDGVRSLLSSEGVRWFLGDFTRQLASPWLVWLLLVAIAGGSLWQSGLLQLRLADYRQRVAVVATFAFLLLYVTVIVLLAAIPHAVLLSATGHLFPSAFSRALVPIVAFGITLCALTFGLLSGRFATLADALWSLVWGPSKASPLLLLYIFVTQFCASFVFVFC